MDYILGFVLLLGVLVFIHEFGHFIIAKACGVRVETFSIGMGKKILKFRRGETEYALSLVPLGGYVKLTGQDPREEVPPELMHKSFQSKGLSQRAAIVLAGPIFNAVLAFLVLSGLFMVGVPVQSPALERVLPGSPAAEAGFKTGDLVESIEKTSTGQVIRLRELSDLEEVVGSSTGENLVFNIVRHADSSKAHISFSPVKGSERDSTLGIVKERGVLPGVERRSPAPVIMVGPHSWAERQKLPSSFWVTELSAGEQIFKPENYFDLEAAWLQISAQKGPITLKGRPIIVTSDAKIENKPEQVEPPEQIFTLNTARDPAPATLKAAGFSSSELVVIEVKEKSPAEKFGLKAGDMVTTLNGLDVHSFQSFKDNLQTSATSGHPVKLGWVRKGTPMHAEVQPEVVSTQDPLTEVKKDQFQIGAAFLALPASPVMSTVKAHGIFEAASLGFNKSVSLTSSMLASFYHLAHGDISPKTLGGPILIGKIAGESFRQGYVAFLRMMAFISLNLFILNLLPVPVLDGGHLILYCIEAIRRKPLSIKVVEAWTTAGFFILMGLVAVVFFNDLSRLGLFHFWRS